MILENHPFAALRSQLALAGPRGDEAAPVAFGIDAVDARLGGGIARAALHELFAAHAADAGAAAGFALMLALRGCADGKPVIWLREDRGCRMAGRLHAPGLAELGADPDALYLVGAPDTLALLRAGVDIARCGAVGAVVIEPWGKAPALDLTASRRLAMAAAASGVMTLVLRVDAQPGPSAAQTRWRVASAASTPLGGDAPGLPAFDISLLRHRGGIAGFDARMEWNRDERCFRTPLSGGVPAVPALGTGAADGRRAA